MARHLLRSFSGGEVSQELFGRGDTVKLQTGLALAKNFVTLPHGPARNRPGTIHFGKSKLGASGKVALLPFVFSTSQAYVIEFGGGASASNGYFRFYNSDSTPVLYGAPVAFITSKTWSIVGAPTSEITCTGHGLSVGQKVSFTTTISLPVVSFSAQLVVGQTYYVLTVPSADKITIHAGDSVQIGPFINTGAGAHTVHRRYDSGDIASSGGQNYYSLKDNNSGNAPPSATWWYQLPQNPNLLEIPHPYIADNLQFVRYFQSNDVMTLLHEDHPPRELRRYSSTKWGFIDIAFAPPAAPEGVVANATEAGVRVSVATVAGATPLEVTVVGKVPFAVGETLYGTITAGATLSAGFYRAADLSGSTLKLVNLDGSNIAHTLTLGAATGSFKSSPPSAALTNYYKVTSVDVDGRESQASAEASVANNLFVEGAYNTITWSSVVGAVRYNVYKQIDGLYGWVGSTEANVFTMRDDNLEAQLDRPLPFFDASLSSGPYPEAGCYHEQRRAFARAQNVWLTRTGTESDLSYSLPVKSDDRIDLPIAATEFCRIQHLVSLGDLVALTSSIEYLISPTDSAVLVPGSVMARPQSFIGSSHVRPAVVRDRAVFAAARGGHVQEFSYKAASQGFVTSDLSVFAPHLFDNLSVAGFAYAKAPYPILWVVSSSGVLLGLTYMPEQEVAGWHQHSFTGLVKAAVAIPHGNEDRLFLAVERTVAGVVETHFSYMAPWALGAVADSVYADSAVVLTNAPAGVTSGFSHLAGAKVAILADGIVLPQQTVTAAGKITLPAAKATYAKVVVGLPIDARLQTLPVFMQVEAMAQGREKTVARMWARVKDAAPFRFGPDEANLVPSDASAPAIRGLSTAQPLVSDTILMRAAGSWSQDAQLLVIHTLPLPLTISTLTLEVAFGD